MNCREYEFEKADYDGRACNISTTRGSFYIPLTCRNCGAEMALVVWEEIQHNELPTYNTTSVAIAYRHTINDEPCYEEDCKDCYGKNADSERKTGDNQSG